MGKSKSLKKSKPEPKSEDEVDVEADPRSGFLDEDMNSKIIKEYNKVKVAPLVEDSALNSLLKHIANKKTEDAAKPVDQEMADVSDGSEIGTVQKGDVFGGETTSIERDIIQQRVALKQKHFLDHERREALTKIRTIQKAHRFVSEDEASRALKVCGNDEDEVIVFLMDFKKFKQLRKTIALEHEVKRNAERPKDAIVVPVSGYKFVQRKRKNMPLKRGPNGEVKYIYKKLRLDDAIEQGNQEGWSEARKKAHGLFGKNLNTFYYRFNDPGVKQKNGKWEKEEVELFWARYRELGADGSWGIFSMTIPGRVGYQCSNFYRQLIGSGEIKDPNYFIDEKGHLRHLKKTKLQRTDSSSRVPEPEKTAKPTKKLDKKKRKKSGGDDDDDDDVDEYLPAVTKRRKASAEEDEFSGEDDVEYENPLPGFTDPITLDDVERPAISPFGHVMSYSSWSRCLTQEPRNICPISKNSVKKRDLVVLTWQNIDQYFDKIVNLPPDYQRP